MYFRVEVGGGLFDLISVYILMILYRYAVVVDYSIRTQSVDTWWVVVEQMC